MVSFFSFLLKYCMKIKIWFVVCVSLIGLFSLLITFDMYNLKSDRNTFNEYIFIPGIGLRIGLFYEFNTKCFYSWTFISTFFLLSTICRFRLWLKPSSLFIHFLMIYYLGINTILPLALFYRYKYSLLYIFFHNHTKNINRHVLAPLLVF